MRQVPASTEPIVSPPWSQKSVREPYPQSIHFTVALEILKFHKSLKLTFTNHFFLDTSQSYPRIHAWASGSLPLQPLGLSTRVCMHFTYTPLHATCTDSLILSDSCYCLYYWGFHSSPCSRDSTLFKQSYLGVPQNSV
jgi:hypothetical protein